MRPTWPYPTYLTYPTYATHLTHSTCRDPRGLP